MSTPTFYIFHGDDSLGIDEAVGRIRASMGNSIEAEMNISEFDGESSNVAEIINAARSFPFLADKRLVLVRGMIAHLISRRSEKDIERLLEALPNLPDYARLVFVERGSIRKDHKLLKLADASERGLLKEYSAPKDATDWIIKRARDQYEARIDRIAAEALASVVGSDLRRADNELVKLTSYAEGRSITEDDVALLTPYEAEAKGYQITDALLNGNGRQALALLTTFLAQDPRDPGFVIFAQIVTTYRQLLLAREHLDEGGNSNSLASSLSIKPFIADKLMRQARSYALADLENIFRRLQRYDYDIKTGRIEPRLALDLFIASMTRR